MILLEKYDCGTWLSSFCIKSFNIITVPGLSVVHLKILGLFLENMASHLLAKYLT